MGHLRRAKERGVHVLNEAGALLASHDKLMTAIRLAAAGVPHPRTAHVDGSSLLPSLTPPYVVKPRFGSWGRDVYRCEDSLQLAACLASLAGRPWFERQGVLVQELIPPRGYDLRVIVAGGIVAGAIERVAGDGEWRTNISLGGWRRQTDPPEEARALAVEAAAALGGDLVGVDLLPDRRGGWTVLEINGAVDFTARVLPRRRRRLRRGRSRRSRRRTCSRQLSRSPRPLAPRGLLTTLPVLVSPDATGHPGAGRAGRAPVRCAFDRGQIRLPGHEAALAEGRPDHRVLLGAGALVRRAQGDRARHRRQAPRRLALLLRRDLDGGRRDRPRRQARPPVGDRHSRAG